VDNQFVITDGVESIHLVEQRPTPQPHLTSVKDTALGPTRAVTRTAFAGGSVLAGASEPRLVTFTIPALEVDDPIGLTAEVVWGPYAVGDLVLVSTAAGKLVAVNAADGTTAWQQDQELSPVGAPLHHADAVLLTFPNGVLQKRVLATGDEAARLELKQQLAAGTVAFEQRLAIATDDGAILIVKMP
jgi:outer membrane protein assembly factor BamB